MKIDPRMLAFDIDGVVADTAGAFLRMAAADYGVDHLVVDDIREFEVEDCLDMDPAAIREIFRRLMDDPLGEELQPMPGAMDVLEDLARQADLSFVTARPSRQPILDWLETHLSSRAFGRVRLVATGEHDNKADHLRQLGVRFFIDDRAATCTALARQGFSPIVFEQPWNRGQHALPVVDSWPAIHGLCFPGESIHEQSAVPLLRAVPPAASHR